MTKELKECYIFHRRSSTVNDVVSKPLPAAGGLLGLQEPGLPLLEAEPQREHTAVESPADVASTVAGVELQHHGGSGHGSVGGQIGVGGGEIGEAEDLLEEIVGLSFGGVGGHRR